MDQQRLRRTIVLDGDHGWARVNEQPAEELTGDALTEEKERAFATWMASIGPLLEPRLELHAARPQTINGRPAVGVRVGCPGHREVVLYFDKEAGLLVKKETLIESPRGNGQLETQETFYGEYQAVDGIMVPFHFQVHRRGELSLDCRVTSVRLLPSLDRALFVRPE
jgi:hypothetical protein